jgi:hypothetical protein
MKIAVLVCGETRTWDSTDVEKNSVIPKKYSCVSEAWHDLKVNCKTLPGITVDFYGITWKHCQSPKNAEFFKAINFLDYYTGNFRNSIQQKTSDIVSSMNTLYKDDSEYSWNTVAQYYQWIDGFKFVYEHDDYDFVFKTRWDIVPREIDTFLKFFTDLKNLQDQHQCYFGVERFGIIEHSKTSRTIKFLDINFVINKQLFCERFSKNSTAQILYDHACKCGPGNFGNYTLIYPADDIQVDRKTVVVIPGTMYTRIMAQGFHGYGILGDQEKNLGTTCRPPT